MRKRKIGRLTFVRKTDAKPVNAIPGLENGKCVCLTAEYNKFIIKRPIILGDNDSKVEPVVETKNQNENTEKEELFNFEEFKSFLPKRKEQPDFDWFDDPTLTIGFDYLPNEQRFAEFVNDDIVSNVNPKKGKITKEDRLSKFNDFKQKVWNNYNDKLAFITNSRLLKSKIHQLKERWELLNSENFFNVLKEPDVNIVCLDNWVIEEENFLEEFHSIMEQANLAVYSLTDFYLFLSIILFGQRLNRETGDIHFIPQMPQLIIEDSGNVKRMFFEIFPVTDGKDLKDIFSIIKTIRENYLGKSHQYRKHRESPNLYTDSRMEQVYMLRLNGLPWKNIVFSLNELYRKKKGDRPPKVFKRVKFSSKNNNFEPKLTAYTYIQRIFMKKLDKYDDGVLDDTYENPKYEVETLKNEYSKWFKKRSM